jgi:hypothetical protein
MLLSISTFFSKVIYKRVHEAGPFEILDQQNLLLWDVFFEVVKRLNLGVNGQAYLEPDFIHVFLGGELQIEHLSLWEHLRNAIEFLFSVGSQYADSHSVVSLLLDSDDESVVYSDDGSVASGGGTSVAHQWASAPGGVASCETNRLAGVAAVVPVTPSSDDDSEHNTTGSIDY